MSIKMFSQKTVKLIADLIPTFRLGVRGDATAAHSHATQASTCMTLLQRTPSMASQRGLTTSKLSRSTRSLISSCRRQSTRLRIPAYPAPQTLSRRQLSTTMPRRSLNIDNINPNVIKAEYAVRGELATRAEKYREALALGRPPLPTTDTPTHAKDSNLPFSSVINANIGNPQQLDQRPLTFLRQVASILENPDLLSQETALTTHLGYKPDAISRARRLLHEVGSVGAYSQSQGVPGVRNSIARFIGDRDGHPSDAKDIFMTAGASAAVSALLNVICANERTGILTPIPQYPLYTATLSLLNARCVPYFLDEGHAWSTSLADIEAPLARAREEGTDVRALVVINPGNPTGAILDPAEIAKIIDFAARESLVVIADEVYQTNTFTRRFHSFKRTLRDLQMDAKQNVNGRYDNVELASLHSISKGMVGECGHRGGYMELVGFDPEVQAQIYKFLSINLCSPVVGQCLVECMVNPPKPGEASYEVYAEEYSHIADGLRHRAEALYEAFGAMEGVEVHKPQGSMYLFPSIKLPEKAVEAAKQENRMPDEFYVSKMLDETGVCMVPGGGFGQKEGTWHFRTTFLPPGTEWVGRLRRFHEGFMKEFN